MAERMRISAQRIGLMLTAFLMITLIGVFATFAAPIPAMRGVLAERAIASAAATGDPAAMKSALAEARPLLGVTAQKTLATLTPDRAGLARAASLVAADTKLASGLVSYRLRLLVIVIGVLAALFGIALLGIGESRPTPIIMKAPEP
ncbi:hypothetical protein [Acidiphilium sp. JA12-A1]|uniref:hypothetical protein n=1 Tax=Acidiphilium sp. JA12-A1 TaxID=1464546 RepID=UPI0004612A9E|nr:hypothetical protein [Acidiphilium sp. JA12-A1]KDM67207.1 hypothetical protein ACIDI_42c00280 [Acidiphilium sp. JA12-A1]